MKTFQKIILVLCGVVLICFFSACKQEGPAEKVGKKIDNAVEATKENMDEAGKQMDKAADKAGEQMEEAGKKIQDK